MVLKGSRQKVVGERAAPQVFGCSPIMRKQNGINQYIRFYVEIPTQINSSVWLPFWIWLWKADAEERKWWRTMQLLWNDKQVLLHVSKGLPGHGGPVWDVPSGRGLPHPGQCCRHAGKAPHGRLVVAYLRLRRWSISPSVNCHKCTTASTVRPKRPGPIQLSTTQRCITCRADVLAIVWFIFPVSP